MNEILTGLPDLAGGETQVLVLAGLFVGILMVTLGAALAIADRDQIGRRLALAQGDHGAAAIEVRRHLAGEGPSSSKLTRFVAPSDERERLAVRQRLVQAGFRGAHAVRNYYLIRSGLGLVLPLPLLIGTFAFALNAGSFTVDLPIIGFSASSTLVLLALLVALGFYLPPFFLRRRIKLRQRAIREGFPHALDLMQVAVQAGLGFDAALARVGEELQTAHPFLAEEFLVVVLELRAGKPRDRVLQDLALRTGVEEINSFQTVMNQSIRYGTSISDALEIYAKEMRHKRIMRAEELASQMPVKMSLVMVAFLLPTLFLIFMGPVAIRFIRVISPLLSGFE
ncbi:MAG TPA: type II secretion system F family protein [Geminicoccaceae bacterium]|nr:type II secretion system F family protein [Geminicoccaceae bacterium]